MKEIIQSVTTPMALAALAVLIAAVIARLVTRHHDAGGTKKSQDARKSTLVHYGFLVAIILSVLANASFMLGQVLHREYRISGTVQDALGRPLGGAIVVVPGADRGVSAPDGAFAFTIPDSRSLGGYEISVQLDGYRGYREVWEGRSPAPRIVVLDKIDVALESMVTLSPRLQVGHYLGGASVTCQVRYATDDVSPHQLTNVTFRLDGPDGQRVAMPSEASFFPGTQHLMPPLTVVTAEPGKALDVGYSLYRLRQDAMVLVSQAIEEATADGLSIGALPDPDKVVLREVTSRKLQEIARSELVWQPGDWELVLQVNAGGRVLEKRQRFSIMQSQADGFDSLIELYPMGIGVFPSPAWKTWSGRNAAGYVDVVGRDVR